MVLFRRVCYRLTGQVSSGLATKSNLQSYKVMLGSSQNLLLTKLDSAADLGGMCGCFELLMSLTMMSYLHPFQPDI